MTKIPAILSAALTVSLVACGGSKDHTPIGQPVTTPLLTADAVQVGLLTVFNSTDGLYITATAADGWQLLNTRLSVSTSLSGIPHSKSGKPNCDRFLLRRHGNPSAAELGYTLPLLVQPGTELFIALQADVRPVSTVAKDDGHDHADCGDDSEKTSAWALGTPFPGNDGSMYLTYVIRAAAAPNLVGQFKTCTQATWGATPAANQPDTYLSVNFSAAFPSGVTLGLATGNSAQFLNSQAVTTFLPQTGTPGVLPRHSINPVDLSNPFAGETLALALNVGFDTFDAAFSSSTVELRTLVVADPSSACFGLTVGDVLDAANLLLAGRADLTTVTLNDAFDAVTRINANFENGTADLGFLALP